MAKTNKDNKMNGAIAAFVKTPGLSPIKTRLAASIGQKKAEELFLQFVEKIQIEMQNASKNAENSLTTYWAVGEKEGLKSPYWSKLDSLHTGEGDLADRMSNIYSTLLEKHDYVILIGSDSPDLSEGHISEAINIIKKGKFVFGPTYDGGFYLFGGQKPIEKAIWKLVEYSKSDVLLKLSGHFAKINDIEYLETLVDIDEIEDLKMLYNNS